MSQLFSNFEVNRQSRWQAMSGLLGGSVILHFALAATVLYVPSFRDALNIAVLAGQTGYVDRAYQRTMVGEDIQMVGVSQKFRYPDGYFATDFGSPTPVPTPDPMTPKIVSTYIPPKPERSPSPLPSPVPSLTPAEIVAEKSASPVPSSAASVTADAAGEKKVDEKKVDDEVLGIKENEINTRPLKDWLGRANALKEKGMIDLDADLEMTIDAKLNADCKLDDPRVVQKSGDNQMVDLAKDLAAAISDSRMLLFLKDPERVQQEQKSLRCDPMPLRFGVKLDQTDFNATVETEADSPDRASQLTRLYNWALAGGEIKKRGRDEEVIFKNTKVTAEGKQIVVRFKMPRQTASDLLKKQIEPKPAT